MSCNRLCLSQKRILSKIANPVEPVNGRMTLFSESGILSVKTGGIRDEKGKSNDEELARLDTSENALDHKQGLFSPDCYNGKSLFTMGEED